MKKHLLKAAYYTPVSSSQYQLYPPNKNNSQCALSKDGICAVQTQCHIYPISMSWWSIVQSPCGFERVTFLVDGIFLSPTTSAITLNKPSGDLRWFGPVMKGPLMYFMPVEDLCMLLTKVYCDRRCLLPPSV